MISRCWRFVAVAGTTLLLSSTSVAATFLVDSVVDEIDAVPGDGICATALGSCTLRAAIMEANELAGADEIELPAGTYAFAIGPSGPAWPPNASTGDLDILDDLTIAGAGAGEATVDGNGLDRVFESSAIFRAANLTLRGGSGTSGPRFTSPPGTRFLMVS